MSLASGQMTEDQRKYLMFDGTAVHGPDMILGIIDGLDLPALRKADLLNYLSVKRWMLETGGIEVSGMQVRTDRESQALINGAYNMAKENDEFTTDFKAAGGFVTLTAPQIIAVALAVGAHVAACFGVEKSTDAAIRSNSITTKAQIDEAMVL